MNYLHLITHLFILMACLSSLAAEKPLPELVREANQVLADPDNVARRKQIEPVFELAKRYADTGQTNDAVKYYRAALEHHPWHLDGQMRLAELLRDTGAADAATEKAQLVYRHAETDALLSRAAIFLRKSTDPTFITNVASPESPYAVVLVPLADVDAWLLQEIRRQLQTVLNIRVSIEKSTITIPKPRRDPMRVKAADLRQRIIKSSNDPVFRELLRHLNLSTNKLDRDEDAISITGAVLNSLADKEQARRFREEMAFLRHLGPQWDAADLLSGMVQTLAPTAGSRKGYLGVTALDLFSNESRYVFGSAAIGANYGVFSYRRYTSLVNDEPPDRERLAIRALKQALSSTGFLFGLVRCTDPTCARAYANSLPEHDAKEAKLCSQCKKAFRDRFAR